MTKTLVIDLDRWRSERAVQVAPEQVGSPVDQPAARGGAVVDQQEAEVLHLPPQAPAASQEQPAPPVRSVFGPVMAFGLARREPATRAAAVGEDEAITPRVRALRQRHLRDARGASRGPGR